jgi:hypothetical protein
MGSQHARNAGESQSVRIMKTPSPAGASCGTFYLAAETGPPPPPQMRIYDLDAASRETARQLLGREFAPCTGAPPQLDAGATNAWGRPLRTAPAPAAGSGRGATPWAGRRDTLSYGLKLLSRSKEDEPREFTMTLSVASNQVSATRVP